VYPCFKGHTVLVIAIKTMAEVGIAAAAAEDMLCMMMMMTPLMMPFIWGLLFGMCLLISQET
jgi:hypothetical protein